MMMILFFFLFLLLRLPVFFFFFLSPALPPPPSKTTPRTKDLFLPSRIMIPRTFCSAGYISLWSRRRNDLTCWTSSSFTLNTLFFCCLSVIFSFSFLFSSSLSTSSCILGEFLVFFYIYNPYLPFWNNNFFFSEFFFFL